MTKKQLTCGVPDHTPECLCDVILKDGPGEIKSVIPYSYQFGPEIVERLQLGVPWTGNALVVFLQAIDKLEYYRRRPNLWVNGTPQEYMNNRMKKLTPEQLDVLKDLIRDGLMPTAAAETMNEQFGVNITRSYVAKTKSRMIDRGELQC